MGKQPEWPYHFEIIPLERMFIDEAYQRAPTTLVQRIQENFDPALVGSLVLSQHKDGRYAVIDGQTRMAAMRKLGHLSAPSLVYEGLDQRKEAELFSRFQSERKQISALDRFKAATVAKEHRALEIAESAKTYGFVLEKSPYGNAIAAVAALEDIYDRYGIDRLGTVLDIVGGSWDHQHSAANTNEMLRGLAHFLNRNPHADIERLKRKLRPNEPRVLLTRAGQLRQGRGLGGKSPAYMSEVIAGEYARRGQRAEEGAE